MRFGWRFFFPSLYRKMKDQNPSISEDFTKTFLKWPRDGLEPTALRQCWSSGQKNVLRKLLRIPYRRLKAGFSVCWLFVCVALWEVWLILNEIHEMRSFAPCKAFLFVFVVVVVVVFSSLENYFGFRTANIRVKTDHSVSLRWNKTFWTFPKRFVFFW